MSVRTPVALIAVAALTLGAAACTKSETSEAKSDAAVAGEQVRDATAQTGEVIEGGAMKAAQAVQTGAGKVADHLEANQAEAAAEGKPGAIDPATGKRVPAPAN